MDLDDLQEKAHADALSAFLEQRLREARSRRGRIRTRSSRRRAPGTTRFVRRRGVT